VVYSGFGVEDEGGSVTGSSAGMRINNRSVMNTVFEDVSGKVMSVEVSSNTVSKTFPAYHQCNVCIYPHPVALATCPA
jgi:hypothetical protein